MRNVTVTATDATPAAIEADVVYVGAHSTPDGYALTSRAAALDAAMGGSLVSFLDAVAFEAKPGQARTVAGGDSTRSPLVGVVGLGPEADVTADVLRSAAATAARDGGRQHRIALALDGAGTGGGHAVTAVVEGALLGSYTFDAFKSEATPPRVEELIVLEADAGDAERGRMLAAATVLARDLANTPAGELPPRVLADRALGIADAAGLAVEVWEAPRIRDERLGGLLAVAAGSVEEPRLIRLTYTPDASARAHLVLVGKGITFDSGGLSLKPADGMESMKTDMSGAAAVMGAMSAIAALKPPVTVTAIVPASENMPSGAAQKPGDVFTARNGKTVEVLNTDAEGRLVLADGLSLAAELGPDAIVDVATLTGACMVALGPKCAGLFASDDALAGRVEDAAALVGEPVWRMPLMDDYKAMLESEVADMKNIGERWGGAITAGLFLSEFVGETPWAHLDIAGPARADRTDGWIVKGATGFATRTLVELVDSYGTETA
ncbi:MAG: leucyl aminopeptidase [Acidimicrobiia bacterium]|nr:leucyl aminopeptidase [Acidimicrobiia bacterium]